MTTDQSITHDNKPKKVYIAAYADGNAISKYQGNPIYIRQADAKRRAKDYCGKDGKVFVANITWEEVHYDPS